MPQTIIFTIIAHPELVPDDDLVPLIEALSNLSPILDDIGLRMAQYQEHNLDDQGATFGEPWDPLKPRTLAEKRRLGYPEQTMVRTGRLASELGSTMILTPDSVTTGINLDEVPYAAFQNRWRVLVSVTDAEMEEFYQMLRAYIAKVTGGTLEGIEIRAEIQ